MWKGIVPQGEKIRFCACGLRKRNTTTSKSLIVHNWCGGWVSGEGHVSMSNIAGLERPIFKLKEKMQRRLWHVAG